MEMQITVPLPTAQICILKLLSHLTLLLIASASLSISPFLMRVLVPTSTSRMYWFSSR